MLNKPDEEIFPRPLTEIETEWLFDALPENKPGYRLYRERISKLFVIGLGRFGGGNLVLGGREDKVDLGVSSAAVIAAAEIEYRNVKVSVLIHQEQFGQIEIDIRKDPAGFSGEASGDKSIFSLSGWMPGEKAGNSKVREVAFAENNFVLAIVPDIKRIWLFESGSGINHFLPVSSYFNELMRLLGNKDPRTALKPERLFTNLNEFDNSQLALAFVNYNKYARHVDAGTLNIIPADTKLNKKSFFGFLKNR